MYQPPEQLMQFGKSNLEAVLTLANITLQTTERLLDLQLRTAKEALDESMRGAKALTQVKSMQDLVALQSAAAQPGIDKMIAYSRSVYEVASETQAKLNKVVEARVAELSGGLMAAMDEAAKSAPAGSEAAFAAMKSAMAAANTAYDTVTRATRQASDMAASNVNAQLNKVARKKAH